MSNIYDLAKDVDRAQEQLDRAKQRLLAALGTPPKNGRVRRGPGSDSVSARVLSLVEASGAAGITRADIHAKLPGEDKAIHSALKHQSSTKKIWSDEGQWKLAEYAAPRKAKKAKAKTERSQGQES